jgi:hypothetical protein
MKKKLVIGLLCITGVLMALSILPYKVESAIAGERGRVKPPTNLVTVSGHKLSSACRPDRAGSFEDGICLGYVLAVADLVNNGSIGGKEACASPGVLHVEMQSAAHEYFANHRELLNRLALELVAAALAEAFSCSGSER